MSFALTAEWSRSSHPHHRRALEPRVIRACAPGQPACANTEDHGGDHPLGLGRRGGFPIRTLMSPGRRASGRIVDCISPDASVYDLTPGCWRGRSREPRAASLRPSLVTNDSFVGEPGYRYRASLARRQAIRRRSRRRLGVVEAPRSAPAAGVRWWRWRLATPSRQRADRLIRPGVVEPFRQKRRSQQLVEPGPHLGAPARLCPEPRCGGGDCSGVAY